MFFQQKTIKNRPSKQQGFTLVELIAVMAIITILSATIIVSLQSYKDRSKVDKMLAEISAAVEKAYLCWADDGEVKSVSAGDDICDLGPGYGKWPDLESGFSYNDNMSGINNWWIKIVPPNDLEQICCSSTNNRCIKQESNASCP